MAEKIKTQKNSNLKNKFRFVVLNDSTFEEKFSLSLTRTNVWIFLSVVVFTLIFLTAAAIVYTPLKYFIPGFGDYNYRSQILQLQFKTDSLQNSLDARALWLENLVNVANGTIDSAKPGKPVSKAIDKSQIKLDEVTPETQQLRKEVEEEDNYSLSYNAGHSNGAVDEVKRMHLMDPVDGLVTEEYDINKEHFGIDIAAKQDAPVKAVLDGEVVSDSYTFENGYVLVVQHPNSIISIYKHCSRLLKKTGNTVKAGEVIALTGNTGETSTGPHLHFELWYMGKSINPRDYIVF